MFLRFNWLSSELRTRCLFLVSMLGVAVVACEEQPERAGRVATEGQGGAAVFGGTSNPTYAEGGATGGSATLITGDAISGEVVLVSNHLFGATSAFDGAGTFGIEGASSSAWIDAKVSTGLFVADGVELGSEVWAGFIPDDALTYYSALTLVDSTSPPVEIKLTSRETLDRVFDTFGVPTSAESGTGHVVLRMVDSQGYPLANIAASMPDAPVFSYGSSGTWTEYGDATTSLGLVFFGNVPAQAFPGVESTVTLTDAGAVGLVSQQINVRVASDTVTYLDVVVATP